MRIESRRIASDLELAVALEFSAPSTRGRETPHFIIEGFDDETVITIPKAETRPGEMLYGSKESIAFAVGLAHVWRSRGDADGYDFVERARHYGRFLAKHHKENEQMYIRSFSSRRELQHELLMFQEHFNLHNADFREIDEKTHSILEELESRRFSTSKSRR